MIEILTVSKIVLFALLIFALIYSIRLNVKLGVCLLKVEDSVEESLDILDSRYKSVSEILEIPIFFDSIEVRQVISDIEQARDSILKVANVLASISEKEYVLDEVEN